MLKREPYQEGKAVPKKTAKEIVTSMDGDKLFSDLNDISDYYDSQRKKMVSEYKTILAGPPLNASERRQLKEERNKAFLGLKKMEARITKAKVGAAQKGRTFLEYTEPEFQDILNLLEEHKAREPKAAGGIIAKLIKQFSKNVDKSKGRKPTDPKKEKSLLKKEDKISENIFGDMTENKMSRNKFETIALDKLDDPKNLEKSFDLITDKKFVEELNDRALKKLQDPFDSTDSYTRSFYSIEEAVSDVLEGTFSSKEVKDMLIASGHRLKDVEKIIKILDNQMENLYGRDMYQEGGPINEQMDMMLNVREELPMEETPMEPDNVMENNYTDFIIEQALTEEEEDMLVNKLEQDNELQMLFDKVFDVAQEFAGSGPVEGPGSGVSDSIPARLSDGEFVFTAKATKVIGADNLQQMMEDAEAQADGNRQSRRMGGTNRVFEEQPRVDRFGKPMDVDLTREEVNKNMMSVNPRLQQRR
jgi:hypothetical protein